MTDQDRAEFEKWSLGVGADECDLVQDDNGDYMSRKTRDYWGVWLAARRTQYEVGYATTTQAELKEHAKQNCQELCGSDTLPISDDATARRSQDEQVRELCGLIKTLHSEELQDRGEVPVLLDDIATLAAQLKEQQDAK